LKRLGERLQGDVVRFIDSQGVPMQPSQYPLLAALDALGPLTVGELAEAVRVAQPGVTRNLTKLVGQGLVETQKTEGDQRRRTVRLTERGNAVMAATRERLWPGVEAAVLELCAELRGALLEQVTAIEAGLDAEPLHQRARRQWEARR
jgi:DNA-binding MarR family transcriptional regulator